MDESKEDARLRHQYIESINKSLEQIEKNLLMLASDNLTEEDDGSI